MRIAVLVKQISSPEKLSLEGGRLVRTGVELEVNAFCRRANTRAVELAGDGGEVVVFTMGPPSAEDALREMMACGANRGVHLCDGAFVGADTLATSRALAAILQAEGPFALVLAGLNSLDADTGQVGPSVAALLGLPFAAGVRELELDGDRFQARLELDDGYAEVEGPLPAVLTTAERLCDPSKAPPEARASVDGRRIRVVGPADLGLAVDDCGELGSPTWVGTPRTEESTRHRYRASSVDQAVRVLEELGALDDPELLDGGYSAGTVPATGGADPQIWCFLDLSAMGDLNLLGEAAHLAALLGGSATAIVPAPAPAGLGSAGADRVVEIPGAGDPERWAVALATAAASELPWALLIEGTRPGRALASTVAARNGWGLTGDAIDLELSVAERLVAWKPAFGGRLVVPIETRSPVQMVTVRPGVLPGRSPRVAADPTAERLPEGEPGRIVVRSVVRNDDAAVELLRATTVVGVGTGADPANYHLLDPLRGALGGAVLAATRRVTDKGWLPHSRQVGVTGHSIAPHLYVAVGISGRFNHMVGVRKARTILALNHDPDALVFEHADVGLVGNWEPLVGELATVLAARRAEKSVP